MSPICPVAGCMELVDGGRCVAHRRRRTDHDWSWSRVRTAYVRRHPRCEEPGCREATQEVHHRDGDNQNHDPSNLIALCRAHHLARHRSENLREMPAVVTSGRSSYAARVSVLEDGDEGSGGGPLHVPRGPSHGPPVLRAKTGGFRCAAVSGSRIAKDGRSECTDRHAAGSRPARQTIRAAMRVHSSARGTRSGPEVAS